jgi:hypothetical protein
MNNFPKRIILTMGEIKRIGMFSEFCKSEQFEEDGAIQLASDDMMFSLNSDILPKDYSYKVPKGYIIKGYNG